MDRASIVPYTRAVAVADACVQRDAVTYVARQKLGGPAELLEAHGRIRPVLYGNHSEKGVEVEI